MEIKFQVIGEDFDDINEVEEWKVLPLPCEPNPQHVNKETGEVIHS
jgi:hypothetical protein